MWFLLALLALSMLVVRRTTEKTVSGSIDSLALAWLQQAWAMPFILISLFFAKFYTPSELPAHFWTTMVVYVICGAIDIYCYFKALSLADITYVAPLMTLVAVGNVVGAYFVLGQRPSAAGMVGASLIVLGAWLINKAKSAQKHLAKQNRTALIYVMILVLIRSYYSNIELSMTRISNPTSFNFYSSVLTVPFIILVAVIIKKQRRAVGYWRSVAKSVRPHVASLLFIGLTYTINLTATYQAKLIGPNAGYIGAIKSASVLPIVLVGVFIFKEKITRLQIYGLIVITIGLIALGTN